MTTPKDLTPAPQCEQPGATGLRVLDGAITYEGRLLLHEVRLDVPPGHIVALLGPSGSGKSSLLRCIVGVQPLTSGSISWDGHDITGVATHRRGFGLVFQDALLFPHLNVAANIAFGLRFTSGEKTNTRQRVGELLELVGLEGFSHRGVDTLSGGEAQRVALARALAPGPRLLCLDEPFGALDRDLRERLVHDVRELLTLLGTPAIHVTHDPDEAEQLADEVRTIRDGSLDPRC
ncbi:MAG: ABC transporter ATP-binding protein [Candidatus Nanopelagicales bacterium]|nr:ABC transporter ATP-binding protein [Candidatus Nanopelagicales bacterium]